MTLNEGNVRERPTILISQVNSHAQTGVPIIKDMRNHSLRPNIKTNCLIEVRVYQDWFVVCVRVCEREAGKDLINCN